MTIQQTSDLILTAITLQQEIAALELRLESHKSKLRAEAEKLLREDGILDMAGSSYEFVSNSGPTARVSFPKPGLVRQFWFTKEVAYKKDGDKVVPLGGDVRELCGVAFGKLFAMTYKPAKAFRDLLPALLTPKTAAKVLELCQEPPFSPRVTFEVKASAPA